MRRTVRFFALNIQKRPARRLPAGLPKKARNEMKVLEMKI
jgi:hypothetical protein